MADHFQQIYAEQAELYHRLVMAEDHQHNLLELLQQARPLEGLRVMEAGAGTGRVTRLLLEANIDSIHAIEPADAMREVARDYLGLDESPKDGSDARGFGSRCIFEAGEVEALPAPSSSFDMAVAAWVVGHFTDWYPQDWQRHVDRALAEMKRTLVPGGALVLIESLGTGNSSPQAPSPIHRAYYDYLEQDLGLTHSWARTDYAFDSPQRAAQVMGGFFGEAFAQDILSRRLTVIPECTGIWFGTIDAPDLTL